MDRPVLVLEKAARVEIRYENASKPVMVLRILAIDSVSDSDPIHVVPGDTVRLTLVQPPVFRKPWLRIFRRR